MQNTAMRSSRSAPVRTRSNMNASVLTDVQSSNFEVYTNRWDVWRSERILHKPDKDTSLPDSAIPNQKDPKEVVIILQRVLRHLVPPAKMRDSRLRYRRSGSIFVSLGKLFIPAGSAKGKNSEQQRKTKNKW